MSGQNFTKLWQKEETDDSLSQLVERFTVGRDKEFDLMLAPFDILGSIAHVKMLGSIQLLNHQETSSLVNGLKEIYHQSLLPGFTIGEGIEDIHSHVEMLLVEQLGSTGKKIHAARSRNDQVLLDIRLFLRAELTNLVKLAKKLFDLLLHLSNEHKEQLLPGYTHFQLAMPSSFGLWFGAYAESLCDDMLLLQSAYSTINKNPLGSGAGYGSSFPINRTLTTTLLGFGSLNHNVVYAQMGRGKAERVTAQALATVAETLSKLSTDSCIYMNQSFGFISFPESLTTGSSIMPHKKNPDVFEIIRGKCNLLKGIPNDISLLTANLPSGYHRDLQLLKEKIFPSFKDLNDCIEMAILMFSHISVKENILNDPSFDSLFSVEEVNKLVLEGMPFRDAYRKVGEDIRKGSFLPTKSLLHTHEGSIGNLCNEEIAKTMQGYLEGFAFDIAETALKNLLND